MLFWNNDEISYYICSYISELENYIVRVSHSDSRKMQEKAPTKTGKNDKKNVKTYVRELL